MTMTVQEFLEELDGNGLIITDWDLIDETLGWFDKNIDSEVLIDGEEL